MELSSIGKNIRKRREEKSMSRELLAEKTELSSVYIGMIERGEKVPKMGTFIRIINELDISADEILEEVVNAGYKVRMSRYLEKMEKLSRKDRDKIFQIVDIMLEDK